MSVVTDIILVLDCLDDEKYDIINFYFTDIINTTPMSVFEGKTGGGTHTLCATIMSGSYNYFKTNEFMEYLEKNKNKFRDKIKILIQEEHDDEFFLKEIAGTLNE